MKIGHYMIIYNRGKKAEIGVLLVLHTEKSLVVL